MSTTPEFKVGDVVRVKDPDVYVVAFGNKVRDRDATVVRILPQFSSRFQRLRVRFEKRNGRGKPFEESMDAENFIKWPEAAA